MEREKKVLRLVPVAMFCTFLWGSAAPFIKWGYSLFGIEGTGSVLVFAGIRFMLAGVLVLLFEKARHPKKSLTKGIKFYSVVVLALFQTFLQYWFYYVGVAHASGVSSALITGTGAFISLLMSVYVFRYERMSLFKGLGCVIGFLGIMVMNMQGMSGMGFSLMGEGLILASQVFSATSAAFIKKFSQAQDAVLLSGWQFLLGGSALSVTGLGMGGSLPSGSVAGYAVLLYLAFVSAAAYTLWGLLLKEYPLSKVGIFNCIIPLAGIVWSALLLHETKQAFSPNTLYALVLVAGGIYLVNKGNDSESANRRS